MEKTKIIHKSYEEGKLQSVSFEENEVITEGTGALLPGEYDCGVAVRRETIVVTFGHLIINGVEYTPKVGSDGKPKACVIETGEKIIIEAVTKSFYNCFYG